jgi:hypothetical protein
MQKEKIYPNYEVSDTDNHKNSQVIDNKEEEDDFLIYIDETKSSKQFLLNIEGLDIYFPYPPYDCQITYMTKGKLINK